MASNTITVVGNLTRDPELRYTQSGKATVTATVSGSSWSLDKTATALSAGNYTIRSTIVNQGTTTTTSSFGSRLPGARRNTPCQPSWRGRSTACAFAYSPTSTPPTTSTRGWRGRRCWRRACGGRPQSPRDLVWPLERLAGGCALSGPACRTHAFCRYCIGLARRQRAHRYEKFGNSNLRPARPKGRMRHLSTY